MPLRNLSDLYLHTNDVSRLQQNSRFDEVQIIRFPSSETPELGLGLKNPFKSIDFFILQSIHKMPK